MAATQAITYNTDIHGIVRRINRFIVEVTKSVSSNISGTNSFDLARAKSYILSVRSYAAWIVSQPELDLPETSPKSVLLPESPVIPLIENDSMFDLATLFELTRDELVNSQSSRIGSGLTKADLKRLTALLDKADAFLVAFVGTVDPIDVPESAPAVAMSGIGMLGVK